MGLVWQCKGAFRWTVQSSWLAVKGPDVLNHGEPMSGAPSAQPTDCVLEQRHDESACTVGGQASTRPAAGQVALEQ